MTIEILIFGIIAWAAVGWVFLALDWTRQLDLTLGDAMLVALAGLCMGPIAFFVWAAGSYEGSFFKTVIKRKRAKRGQS